MNVHKHLSRLLLLGAVALGTVPQQAPAQTRICYTITTTRTTTWYYSDGSTFAVVETISSTSCTIQKT